MFISVWRSVVRGCNSYNFHPTAMGEVDLLCMSNELCGRVCSAVSYTYHQDSHILEIRRPVIFSTKTDRDRGETYLLKPWTWTTLPLNFSTPSNLGTIALAVNPVHVTTLSKSLISSPPMVLRQTCHLVSSVLRLIHLTDVLSCTCGSRSKWAAYDLR